MKTEKTKKTEKTYGEQFKEAMACKTREKAEEWLKNEIKRHVSLYGGTPDEAKSIILSNIGYMAGYYSKEHSEHIHKMFGAVHPIFGTPDYWDKTKPEDAFQAGVSMAKRQKRMRP